MGLRYSLGVIATLTWASAAFTQVSADEPSLGLRSRTANVLSLEIYGFELAVTANGGLIGKAVGRKLKF